MSYHNNPIKITKIQNTEDINCPLKICMLRFILNMMVSGGGACEKRLCHEDRGMKEGNNVLIKETQRVPLLLESCEDNVITQATIN